MIVTLLSGGLGNQMFQYAAARRLALRHRTDVRLDLRMYGGGQDRRPAGLEAFGRSARLFDLRVAATVASPADVTDRIDPFVNFSLAHRAARFVRRLSGGRLFRSAAHVRERSFRFDPAVLTLPDGVYLHGFWQSWRYFADAADVVRAELQPADPTVAVEAAAFVGQLRSLGGPVVSLHVRRGDLAHAAETLGNATLVYGPPVGLDYLAAAARRFAPDARFLVFSDSAADVAWCRANLPAVVPDAARLHYSEGCPDLADMARMSACDGHVIANSTFSWWAAWLGTGRPGKRVVAPKVWGHPTSGMVTDDLIPPTWEQV